MFKPKSPILRVIFTLIELLVVIGIIAILMTILLPALKKARNTTKRIACSNKLKQLGTGAYSYANDNNGWLPGISMEYHPSLSSFCWWYFQTDPYGGIGDYMGGYVSYPDYMECPSDKYVWTRPDNGNQSSINPSYGMNARFLKATSATIISRARNPAKKVLIGEPAHGPEGETRHSHALDYNGVLACQLYLRHGSTTNIVWLDGHVSSEPEQAKNTILSDMDYWNPTN